MGMIQQGVNQLLGTIGAAARLSPEYETKQQIYSEKKAKSAKMEEQKKLAQEMQNKPVEEQIMASDELGLPRKIAKHNRKLAELGAASPSLAAESLKQARIAEGVAKGLRNKTLRIVPYDSNKGQQRAVIKGQQQVKQRRNFMNYLRDVEISGGGTVGDLPIHAQRAIASQYSKKERKELMDRQDSKKGGNK